MDEISEISSQSVTLIETEAFASQPVGPLNKTARSKYQVISNATRHRIINAFTNRQKISDICKYENLARSSVSSIINNWKTTRRIDSLEKEGSR